MKIRKNRAPRLSVKLISLAIVGALAYSVEVSAQPAQRGAGTIATTTLGVLPQVPLYWHLDTFPDGAAARAAMGARSAVAESFGKTWLFTIAESEWRPINGTRVAKVGPLPLTVGGTFTATYLDAETSTEYASAPTIAREISLTKRCGALFLRIFILSSCDWCLTFEFGGSITSRPRPRRSPLRSTPHRVHTPARTRMHGWPAARSRAARGWPLPPPHSARASS